MSKVSIIARKYNITIRSLHYYDEIDLIVPNRVNGIRIYTKENEEVLKRVLLLRDLGFSLDHIKEFVKSGMELSILRDKRDELINKRNKLNDVISMIDSYSMLEQEPDNVNQLFNPFGSDVREIMGDKELNGILDNNDIDVAGHMRTVSKIIDKIKININCKDKLDSILNEYYEYFVGLVNKDLTKKEFSEIIIDKVKYMESLSEFEKVKFVSSLDKFGE